jgi:hypothetical protein
MTEQSNYGLEFTASLFGPVLEFSVHCYEPVDSIKSVVEVLTAVPESS